jgi:hypothetical protein
MGRCPWAILPKHRPTPVSLMNRISLPCLEARKIEHVQISRRHTICIWSNSTGPSPKGFQGVGPRSGRKDDQRTLAGVRRQNDDYKHNGG